MRQDGGTHLIFITFQSLLLTSQTASPTLPLLGLIRLLLSNGSGGGLYRHLANAVLHREMNRRRWVRPVEGGHSSSLQLYAIE